MEKICKTIIKHFNKPTGIDYIDPAIFSLVNTYMSFRNEINIVSFDLIQLLTYLGNFMTKWGYLSMYELSDGLRFDIEPKNNYGLKITYSDDEIRIECVKEKFKYNFWVDPYGYQLSVSRNNKVEDEILLMGNEYCPISRYSFETDGSLRVPSPNSYCVKLSSDDLLDLNSSLRIILDELNNLKENFDTIISDGFERTYNEQILNNE